MHLLKRLLGKKEAPHNGIYYIGLSIVVSSLFLTPFINAYNSPKENFLVYIESIYDGQSFGLGGANDVAISSDGAFVYVAAANDSAISVFKRYTANGDLTFVEMEKDGEKGVDGLLGAFSVSLSPDNKYVYVAGNRDNAIATFSRNSSDGKLTFIAVTREGSDGVTGLRSVLSVSVSPDGKHVYTAGGANYPLAVFSRNDQDGRLTFIEAHRDFNTIYGITAFSVVVSPDGNHVYLAASSENAVAIYQRDSISGRLSFADVKQGPYLFGVHSVVISADGRHVYTASTGDDAVSVFSRDPASGSLSFIEAKRNNENGVSGLDHAQSISISPSGTYVLVTAFTHGVAVFVRNLESGTLDFIGVQENGSNGVNNLQAPHGLAISPNNKNVYVASNSSNALVIFGLDGVSETLTYLAAKKDGITGLESPSAIAFSPDERNVYVIGYNSVAQFSRNENNGNLSFIAALKDDLNGVDGLDGAAAIIVSSDGKNAYLASSGDNALTAFTRASESGVLSFLDIKRDGVDGVDGLGRPQSLAMSPDGQHIYVPSILDNAVSLFSRDISTGHLTYLGVILDDVNQVDGLYSARSIIVSPDGRNVYIASVYDASVAVFNRDSIRGTLSFSEVHKDGFSGVDGIDGANQVIMSLDGKHVYVSGSIDNALAVFQRDENNGKLTFVETQKEGVNGVKGLVSPTGLSSSPDGAYLFVASGGENALSIFERNPLNGKLLYIATEKDGENGIDGLANANSIVISLDSLHVYVTGQQDNAISQFTMPPDSPNTPPPTNTATSTIISPPAPEATLAPTTTPTPELTVDAQLYLPVISQ